MRKKISLYAEFSEFSQNQIQYFVDIFKKFDDNQDNFIDFNELKRMMEKLGKAQTDIGLMDLIKKVDEDQDGKVSQREFLSLFRLAARGKLACSEVFKTLAESVAVPKEGVPGVANFFQAPPSHHHLKRKSEIGIHKNDQKLKKNEKISLHTEFNEFSQSQIQYFVDTFKKYDKNQDNFIDFNELKRMMEKLGKVQTDVALKDIIKKVDEDQDGKVSQREFVLLFRLAARAKLACSEVFQTLAESVDVSEESVPGAANFSQAPFPKVVKTSSIDLLKETNTLCAAADAIGKHLLKEFATTKPENVESQRIGTMEELADLVDWVTEIRASLVENAKSLITQQCQKTLCDGMLKFESILSKHCGQVKNVVTKLLNDQGFSLKNKSLDECLNQEFLKKLQKDSMGQEHSKSSSSEILKWLSTKSHREKFLRNFRNNVTYLAKVTEIKTRFQENLEQIKKLNVRIEATEVPKHQNAKETSEIRVPKEVRALKFKRSLKPNQFPSVLVRKLWKAAENGELLRWSPSGTFISFRSSDLEAVEKLFKGQFFPDLASHGFSWKRDGEEYNLHHFCFNRAKKERLMEIKRLKNPKIMARNGWKIAKEAPEVGEGKKSEEQEKNQERNG